jgi:hypothetical protein
MYYRVRIIKRGRDEVAQRLPPGRDEKNARQSEREIAGTVRSWIAEREERGRLNEHRHWEMLIRFAQ